MEKPNDSEITFFLSGDKTNIFSRYKKQILQEIGIKEEELKVRPLEFFEEPGKGHEIAKYQYERYEESRKEKMKLIKKALKKRISHLPERSQPKNLRSNSENRIKFLKPILEKSLHNLEEEMKKKNDEIAKQMHISRNREMRFEEEVERLETQLCRHYKTHSQRNRELNSENKSAIEWRTEQDNRRKKIFKIMGERKEHMQSQAVKLGKEYIRESEQLRVTQSKKEQERSLINYYSFFHKTHVRRQLICASQTQQNYKETADKLANLNSRMERSEYNCRRHKEEITCTASVCLSRNAEVFQRSKLKKQFPIEAVKKLWTKYKQISELARKKELSQAKRSKQRRDEYLGHIKHMEETRSHWENLETERTNELEERRIQREAQALHNRLSSSVVFHNRFEVHKSRLEAAQRKVQLLKEEEKLSRRELMLHQSIREEQIEQLKAYKKHIKLLKSEVALQLSQRPKNSKDLRNPYKNAELRSIQRYFTTRQAMDAGNL